MLSNIVKKKNKTKIDIRNKNPAFRNLIIQNRNKAKATNIGMSNRQILLKSIQNALKKFEIEEKDFIIKETRRNIEINRQILDNFGMNALNHYNETQKINYKVKIKKSKFLQPLLNDNQNDYLSSRGRKIYDKYNSQKFIKFPKIIDKTNYNNNKNYSENKSINDKLSIIKNNDDSIDTKNDIYGIEHNKSNESISSFKKIIPSNKKDNTLHTNISNNISIISKRDNNNYNTNTTTNNISMFVKKDSSPNFFPVFVNQPLMTERSNSNFNFKNLGRNKMKKRKSIIDFDYLKYLREIKDKFISEEKKKKNYFNNNRYGYDSFKEKYNYIIEKYFE